MATDRTIMITIGADGRAALSEMDKVSGGMRSISNESKLMEQAMKYTATAITGAISTQLVKAVLDAAIQMDSLTKKFAVFAGSADLGARELKFVRDAANDLGLAVAPLTESYGRFMNAIKGTTNEGEKGRDAFLGISKGMAAVGMSAEEQSRAWAQLNQGIMKGKFEMEDLKTINEAGLPIFKLMADALGITTGELLKMQKEGKLLVEDVLPKLGTSMEKAFGQAAAESANSARANVERFNNAMIEAKTTAGEALLPVFTDIVKFATPAISKIHEMVQAVQILGIKLAANADKRSTFFSNLFSGTGVFSAEGLAKQKETAARADALAQQMIDELLAGNKPASSAYTAAETARVAGNKRQTPVDDSAKKAAEHAKKLAEEWRKSYADIRTEIENLDPVLEKHDQKVNTVFNRFDDLLKKEGADAAQLTILRAELVQAIETRAQYDEAVKTNKQEMKELADAEEATTRLIKINNEERIKAANELHQHQMNMADLRNQAYAAQLSFIGQEQAALDAQTAWKRQRMDEQLAFDLQRDDLSYQEKLARQQQYQEQSLALEQERTQRQADLWWNSAQTYMSYAQQMTTYGIQMLLADESARSQIGKRMLALTVRFLAQSLQAYMFNKAKEHVLAAASAAGQITTQVAQHTTSLSLLGTEAAAWAAFYTAQTLNPFGGQMFIPAAVAMTAVAGGVVPGAIAATTAQGASGVAAELGMAAAWAAGGILVGAVGEAAAGAIEGSATSSGTSGGLTGLSSVGSGAVVATADNNSRQQIVINTHIYGNIVDHDKFARELMPSIQKAVNDGY